MHDHEISDYNYITSSLGNAFFSGLSFNQLWECVSISNNREELDVSIDVTIKLNRLINKENNNE